MPSNSGNTTNIQTSTPVIALSASGTQALAFAAMGDVAYDVTLTGNCTFSLSTPPNTGTFQKLLLMIRPAGFQATLPASSAALANAGGSAPTPSTSAVTLYGYASDGTAPILGGI